MSEIPRAIRNRLGLIAAFAVAGGLLLALIAEPWIGLLVGVVCLSYPLLAWVLIARSSTTDRA